MVAFFRPYRQLYAIATHYSIVYFIGFIIVATMASLRMFTKEEINSLVVFLATTTIINGIILFSIFEHYFRTRIIRQEIIESIQQKRLQIVVFGLLASTGFVSLIMISVAQNWIIASSIVYFTLNTLVTYWRLYLEYKFISELSTVSLTVLENQDVEVVTL
jgi:hypothetical protein